MSDVRRLWLTPLDADGSPTGERREVSMSDRPTPEQIANDFGVDGDNTLDMLAHHGYVIVHPDDHPAAAYDYSAGRFQRAWDEGYNGFRNRIFGGAS